MQRIGEIAAFGTSVSWTIGALVMERSVHRIGVMAVNTLKVAFGSMYLSMLALYLNGAAFPMNVSAAAWLFIGGSAVFGFVIGDYFLFNAYALIGSRLAMLFMSISVPLTAIAAYFIFGEALGPWALLGMALCVSGIAITVVSGKNKQAADTHDDKRNSRRYAKGVTFGLLSGVSMAAATLLTKRGAVGVDPVSATQIRILCACAGFIVFAAVTGKTGEIRSAFGDRRAIGLTAIGGIFGPFVGVGLLLFAIQNADAGIVSTLSSFTPVLIIPPSILLFRKKVSVGEIIGAMIAVSGVALLFV